MLYDLHHLFIYGENFRANVRSAVLVRRLAGDRAPDRRAPAHARAQARQLLRSWCDAGWAHGD